MNIIAKLFYKLAKHFGYYSEIEVDQISDGFRNKLMELTQENIKLQDEVKEFKNKYESISGDTLEELKNTNAELHSKLDKMEANISEAENFYKTIQEQISKVLSEDPNFKFGSTGGIPGSSHVGVSSMEDSEIIISGRTIFLDEITDKIQHASSMHEKYSIALNQLIKYGLLEKVAQRMIQSGALEFTLGYNTNCTSLELFYQIVCKKPNSLLNVDYLKK